MQKIVPHLWFDKEAKQAAEFYASVFRDSKIHNVSTLSGTPSGDVDMVSMQIYGYEFSMISAGPIFKINPSISFTVVVDSKDEIREYWGKLVEGGMALMPLDSYHFSELYGWVKDKFGVTWQLIYSGDQKDWSEIIVPGFMFIGENCGKAEEAMHYYASIFKNSEVRDIWRYDGSEGSSDKLGTVAHGLFNLEGQVFSVLDSAYEHKFAFNEAISMMVMCDTQEEIDYYWGKLSAVAEAEQCGWLKDKYGVSWQIVPIIMHEMMSSGDEEAKLRVTKAFLQMKKFDIEELEKAFKGE